MTRALAPALAALAALAAPAALAALAAPAALAACDSSGYVPDPSGTHVAASPVVVRYEPRPPDVAFDRDMPTTAVVAKEAGDVYRVTFGKCWAKVRRPKTPPKWRVIEGGPCSTSLGAVTISGGEMTVEDDGRMRFVFVGLAPDGKTTVKLTFTGGIKS